MMQSTHLDRRRTTHTGVLSDGRWLAHARREARATEPARATEVVPIIRRLRGAASPAYRPGRAS